VFPRTSIFLKSHIVQAQLNIFGKYLFKM